MFAPYVLEVLEFLQLHSSHPLEKSLRHCKFLVGVVYSIFVIKDILVLCITKISKHVLRVAWKLLKIEQLIQAELFNKPGFVLLRHLHFNFMFIHLISVSLLLIASHIRFVRVREHVSRYRYHILDGVADSKCKWMRIMIERKIWRDMGRLEIKLTLFAFDVWGLLQFFEDTLLKLWIKRLYFVHLILF